MIRRCSTSPSRLYPVLGLIAAGLLILGFAWQTRNEYNFGRDEANRTARIARTAEKAAARAARVAPQDKADAEQKAVAAQSARAAAETAAAAAPPSALVHIGAASYQAPILAAALCIALAIVTIICKLTQDKNTPATSPWLHSLWLTPILVLVLVVFGLANVWNLLVGIAKIEIDDEARATAAVATAVAMAVATAVTVEDRRDVTVTAARDAVTITGRAPQPFLPRLGRLLHHRSSPARRN